MTSHDVGLADLFRATRLVGAWPERLVLLGAQPAWTGIGTELSESVRAVLDRLVGQLTDELGAWGASTRSRLPDRRALPLAGDR